MAFDICGQPFAWVTLRYPLNFCTVWKSSMRLTGRSPINGVDVQRQLSRRHESAELLYELLLVRCPLHDLLWLHLLLGPHRAGRHLPVRHLLSCHHDALLWYILARHLRPHLHGIPLLHLALQLHLVHELMLFHRGSGLGLGLGLGLSLSLGHLLLHLLNLLGKHLPHLAHVVHLTGHLTAHLGHRTHLMVHLAGHLLHLWHLSHLLRHLSHLSDLLGH